MRYPREGQIAGGEDPYTGYRLYECMYSRVPGHKSTDSMAANEKEKWTEVEHLPQWDEEFYHIYTAKKHGKWVMMKTLRPEYRDDEKYREMIEKEFDVRYNLAHPNIIMINDFENVPGVGWCIVTDDVYGVSLRQIIDEGKLSDHHISQLVQQLVSALAYIQQNHIVHHPIRPETIIFTENIENLKLIDVGFDQKNKLSPTDVTEDIYNYGMVLREALDRGKSRDMELRKVADRCIDPDPKKRYQSVEDLRYALEGRSQKKVYLAIIAFLAAMVILLVALQVLI